MASLKLMFKHCLNFQLNWRLARWRCVEILSKFSNELPNSLTEVNDQILCKCSNELLSRLIEDTVEILSKFSNELPNSLTEVNVQILCKCSTELLSWLIEDTVEFLKKFSIELRNSLIEFNVQTLHKFSTELPISQTEVAVQLLRRFLFFYFFTWFLSTTTIPNELPGKRTKCHENEWNATKTNEMPQYRMNCHENEWNATSGFLQTHFTLNLTLCEDYTSNSDNVTVQNLKSRLNCAQLCNLHYEMHFKVGFKSV